MPTRVHRRLLHSAQKLKKNRKEGGARTALDTRECYANSDAERRRKKKICLVISITVNSFKFQFEWSKRLWRRPCARLENERKGGMLDPSVSPYSVCTACNGTNTFVAKCAALELRIIITIIDRGDDDGLQSQTQPCQAKPSRAEPMKK